MNCLICGSKEKKILTKLCSNMKIMGPFFPERDSNVVSCPRCGNVYVDIDAEQDAFTKYYSSEYSKSLSYCEVFGRDEAMIYYRNIMERISRYVGKDAHILEVGGGIGELAYFLIEQGYKDITVLEPSERCIKLCREKGIKTILSDGFDIPQELEKTFDFIIINHTLEHILRFDKTLKSVRRMLKDNGAIYIEVPDAGKYADTDFVPYWFFTYEHIVHMTLESFDNLACAFDFEVIEKESYLKCHSYNVMYAIMRKSYAKKPVKYIAATEKAVSKYIVGCEGRLKPVVEAFVESHEPIILWGVGTSTAQLLNGNFDECNVVKLVDSNPYRQNIEYVVGGKKLKIEAPSTINTDDTILILPLMYDESIRRQIKKMGLRNKVKSLIDNYREEK